MSYRRFSLTGLAARICNVLEDLPHIYDHQTGKIYDGGLNSAEKEFVREKSAALTPDKRLTIAFTGAGKVFAEIDAVHLNRKRKAYGFGGVSV